MKKLIIEVGKQNISIYKIKTDLKPKILDAVVIPFDAGFENGAFLDKPTLFADSIAASIKNHGDFKHCSNCVLVLDNAYVLSKDFSHNKISAVQLTALAKIEAEAIVPNRSDDYVVLPRRYGNDIFLDGFYRSMLTALSKNFVQEFTKRLHKSRLKLVAIVARSSVYSDFACSLAGKNDDNYTAFVNFGKQKTHLSIFERKALVYEGSFPSVYPDIINEAVSELEISKHQAERLFQTSGIDKYSDIYLQSGVLFSKVDMLMGASMVEVMRAAKIAASSQRKTIDKIFVTGDFATMPGFKTYFAEAFGAGCKVLDTLDDGNFMAYADRTKLNFLLPLRRVQLEKRRLNVLFLLLVLFTLAIFAVKPYSYYLLQQNRNTVKEDYEKKQASETMKNIQLMTSLQQQLTALEQDSSLGVLNSTRSGEYISKLFTLFYNKATINSFIYHTETKTFDVSFTVPTLNDYVEIKNYLNTSTSFEVSIPFTGSVNEGVLCKVTLKVK